MKKDVRSASARNELLYSLISDFRRTLLSVVVNYDFEEGSSYLLPNVADSIWARITSLFTS